jgi:pimeloyl-ACP methyl ester carboxylesterase
MILDDLAITHAHATVNGLRMHYVSKLAKPEKQSDQRSAANEADRRDPPHEADRPLVLLLHGFPEMWWSWRYQIEALAEAGYRVVAPDLRGYGETEAKGPYDIDTLRDDVIGLLDHLRADKAIVVAHDWGGAVAWHLASTRQARVQKLVVMNCPHPVLLQKALFASPRQLLRSWYMFFFQLPILPELALRWGRGGGATAILRSLAIDKTHFGRQELAPFADAVLKPGRAGAMIGWYRAAIRAGLRTRRKGPAALRGYQTITVPTLLVWGMEDGALGYDDVVPGIERFVPGVEIQTLPGCGHFVQQEQPREVNRRLVEFLGRTAPSVDAAGSPDLRAPLRST